MKNHSCHKRGAVSSRVLAVAAFCIVAAVAGGVLWVRGHAFPGRQGLQIAAQARPAPSPDLTQKGATPPPDAAAAQTTGTVPGAVAVSGTAPAPAGMVDDSNEKSYREAVEKYPALKDGGSAMWKQVDNIVKQAQPPGAPNHSLLDDPDGPMAIAELAADKLGMQPAAAAASPAVAAMEPEDIPSDWKRQELAGLSIAAPYPLESRAASDDVMPGSKQLYGASDEETKRSVLLVTLETGITPATDLETVARTIAKIFSGSTGTPFDVKRLKIDGLSALQLHVACEKSGEPCTLDGIIINSGSIVWAVEIASLTREGAFAKADLERILRSVHVKK